MNGDTGSDTVTIPGSVEFAAADTFSGGEDTGGSDVDVLDYSNVDVNLAITLDGFGGDGPAGKIRQRASGLGGGRRG